LRFINEAYRTSACTLGFVNLVESRISPKLLRGIVRKNAVMARRWWQSIGHGHSTADLLGARGMENASCGPEKKKSGLW